MQNRKLFNIEFQILIKKKATVTQKFCILKQKLQHVLTICLVSLNQIYCRRYILSKSIWYLGQIFILYKLFLTQNLRVTRIALYLAPYSFVTKEIIISIDWSSFPPHRWLYFEICTQCSSEWLFVKHNYWHKRNWDRASMLQNMYWDCS